MKTRRTLVFKGSKGFGFYKGVAIQEAHVPKIHAEFWDMVCAEMSQADAVFLKIV